MTIRFRAETRPSTGRGRTLRVSVDPIACEAYGYCAELLGEMVTLDEWGYPITSDAPVPPGLVSMARKAARDCPRRAFLLSEGAEGDYLPLHVHAHDLTNRRQVVALGADDELLGRTL